MGMDVWPVVGRRKAPVNETLLPEQLLELAPDDLEFLSEVYADKQQWPLEASIERSYALFSMLSDPTVELWTCRLLQCQPIDSCKRAKELAEAFVENMDKGNPDYLDNHVEDTFSHRYLDNHIDWTLYTIDQLLAVDYDAVAMVDDTWEGRYATHPEGKTYRDLIMKSHEDWPGDYFEFLKKAKTDGWEFVLLSYWG